MWHATIITLFPEMFPGPLQHSISGKALNKKIWGLDTLNPRQFTTDKHQTVDDTPFGGGAGMIIKADIIDQALLTATAPYPDPKIYFLTPRGKPLTQKKAHEIAQHKGGNVFLCGRYEGIDDRVIEKWRHSAKLEEISIGDYILSGGEMAALVTLDACVRLLPGVVNTEVSLHNESFELDLLEFSQYTKPQNWQNKVVPDILLSGNHAKIAEWRQNNAEQITKERRPDLWEAYINKYTDSQR